MVNSINIKRPKRSRFNLSHEYQTTCNMGQIIPVLLEEVVPGDSLTLSTQVMIRTLNMLSPAYARIEGRIDYFYLPNRLMWRNWEKFITNGINGNDKLTYNVPRIALPTLNDQRLVGGARLSEYFGLPTVRFKEADNYINIRQFSGDDSRNYVLAFPWAMYYSIWNCYYRDESIDPIAQLPNGGQNENDEEVVSFNDGIYNPFVNAQSTGDVFPLTKFDHVLYRSWKKDYFTSLQNSPQRGDEARVPIGVQSIANGSLTMKPNVNPTAGNNFVGNSVHGNLNFSGDGLSTLLIKRALAVERWLTINNYAGSRYVEQILGHFGVRVKDYRIDRPAFLGSSTFPVQIGEVANMANNSGDPSQSLWGRAGTATVTKPIKAKFDEHGLVMGLLSLVPQNVYAGTINRYWRKTDVFDFLTPELQDIGDQPVYNSELSGLMVSQPSDQNTPLNPARNSVDSVIGYAPRYGEYSFHPSLATGDMRMSLQYWNLARQYADGYANNHAAISTREFCTAAGGAHRLFTDTDPHDAKFMVDLYHNEMMVRPLKR